MNKKIIPLIKKWLPLAVALTAIFLTIYVVIAQDLRASANDPQIQMAENLANNLNTSNQPNVTGKVNIAKSLSTFTIIYNQNQEVISTNAYLDDKIVTVPSGVLTSTKVYAGYEENRVTWQPKSDVRLAAVVVKYNQGWVVVGRNLREVEFRESSVSKLLILAYLMTILITLAISILVIEFE
jgi:hypothetical protein